MKKLLIFFVAAIIAACSTPETKIDSPEKTPSKKVELDLKQALDSAGITGTVLIVEKNSGDTFVYNEGEINTRRTPASTFKIPNSLIGLESGVIKDENFVIKWDGTKYPRETWNSDHTLDSAYKHSTVWYYQELARRVGKDSMKTWLDRFDYGNKDTSAGVDQFWLANTLKISPVEQVNFLRKIDDADLPVSKRSLDILKKIMIMEETPDYILRAKTGWGFDNGNDVGWYVGYVTVKEKIYYFAACFQNSKKDDSKFAEQRIHLTRLALQQAGVPIKP